MFRWSGSTELMHHTLPLAHGRHLFRELLKLSDGARWREGTAHLLPDENFSRNFRHRLRKLSDRLRKLRLVAAKPHSLRRIADCAIEKFLSKNKGKTYAHDFFRAHINDYNQSRLVEGAAISTVRLELSAIKSFWLFMEKLEAVFLNPTTGVKVKKPSLRN